MASFLARASEKTTVLLSEEPLSLPRSSFLIPHSSFHPMSIRYFYNILIVSVLLKCILRLGTFWCTQKHLVFLQVIDYKLFQKKSAGCGVENMKAKPDFPASFHFHPLFPAKSTWMPLGTRIICCVFIRYCSIMNYIDTKIDLFPVLQEDPISFLNSADFRLLGQWNSSRAQIFKQCAVFFR